MSLNKSELIIEKRDKYLFIKLPAYKSVSQMQSLIVTMFDAVDQYQCGKLFIDFTATHKKIPVLELYELCLYLVSKFGSAHTKIALLASPEAVYPDRFAENVIRNRGLDFIRFVNEEQEALDWLLEIKPISQSTSLRS